MMNARSNHWSTTVPAPRIDWKAERERINIGDLVTRYLGSPARNKGRYLYWLCPFHDDHNPSFVVDCVRRSWRCYPCSLGGDAASFVMRHANVTFPQAVASLTGGSPVPAILPMRRTATPVKSPAAEPTGMTSADALALVRDAERALWTPEGSEAVRYLNGRGLNDETIKAARLGWTQRVQA